VQDGKGTDYVPLKTFLARRLFPDRAFLLFYDIGDGLTFGSPEMQKKFFEWLEIYDEVEHTNFRQQGPPVNSSASRRCCAGSSCAWARTRSGRASR